MKIAIYGYGNLGRGIEAAISHNADMELVAVFSRRADELENKLNEAQYLINCVEDDLEKNKQINGLEDDE